LFSIQRGFYTKEYENIVELEERNDLFEKAVQVYWEEWGNEQNYKFMKMR